MLGQLLRTLPMCCRLCGGQAFRQQQLHPARRRQGCAGQRRCWGACAPQLTTKPKPLDSPVCLSRMTLT